MSVVKIIKGRYETRKGEITIENSLGGWEVSPNTDELETAISDDNSGICPIFKTLREAVQYSERLLLTIQESKKN